MIKKQVSGLLAMAVALPAMASNADFYYQQKFEEVDRVASAYYESMCSEQRTHCHYLIAAVSQERNTLLAALRSNNVFSASDAFALYRNTYREVKYHRCIPPTYIGQADNQYVHFEKLGRAKFGDAAWMSGGAR